MQGYEAKRFNFRLNDLENMDYSHQTASQTNLMNLMKLAHFFEGKYDNFGDLSQN